MVAGVLSVIANRSGATPWDCVHMGVVGFRGESCPRFLRLAGWVTTSYCLPVGSQRWLGRFQGRESLACSGPSVHLCPVCPAEPRPCVFQLERRVALPG